MSPDFSRDVMYSITRSLWRDSVVRMKSLKETLQAPKARRNSAALRSAHSCGVTLLSAADVTTLSACSSVPVRKKTSASCPRTILWKRAATSATTVV
jgi:hypothetical protein